MKALSIFWILKLSLLAANGGLVESLTLFPRLQCLVRFAWLRFDILNFDKYSTYFQDDSQMVLAETGAYVGVDSIKEYVHFISEASPYWTKTDIIKKRLRFRGYNKETKQCEFIALYHVAKTTNPDRTIGEINYQLANMAKVIYDLEERYITRFYVFYAGDYLANALFGYITNCAKTREYVCSVMSGACGAFIDATNDCIGNLASMTVLDTNSQVVGNSQGCRALHAVFAATNTHHCSHLSFTPMADHDGNIKCQTNGNRKVSDLFEQEELQLYERFARSVGIDPTKGHDITIPAM